MIPIAYINEWKHSAPWGEQSMVEQDLILSRILVDLFRDPVLSKQLIFRGGTALHKLCFSQPMRYSEVIFQHYMREEGHRITKAEFLNNLASKYSHPAFVEDCLPLLRPGTVFDLAVDARLVEQDLISLLPSPDLKKE